MNCEMIMKLMTSWPILSQDDEGMVLGAPVHHEQPVPLFQPGDVILNGVLVREDEVEGLTKMWADMDAGTFSFENFS